MDISDKRFYVLTAESPDANEGEDGDEGTESGGSAVDEATDAKDEVIEKAADLLRDGVSVDGIEIYEINLDDWAVKPIPWRDVVSQLVK